MSATISSVIAFVGTPANIDKMMTTTDFGSHLDAFNLKRESDNILLVFAYTQRKAPEFFVKLCKGWFNLEYAYTLSFDYNGFEIVYYKEIDGEPQDFVSRFNELRNVYDDYDELYDACDAELAKIVKAYEGRVKSIA
jgi:hypothetical protein